MKEQSAFSTQHSATFPVAFWGERWSKLLILHPQELGAGGFNGTIRLVNEFGPLQLGSKKLG
jgi:hypothetical protein